MGSKHSKPSKPSKSKAPRKSQISRPKIPKPKPYLDPLPLRPLPHNPKKTNSSAEDQLRSRVKHFHEEVRKPAAQPQLLPRPPVKVVAPKKQQQLKVTFQTPTKTSKPYQFRPLDDIGKSATSRPKSEGNKVGAKTSTGYGLYPAKQKGDIRGGSKGTGKRKSTSIPYPSFNGIQNEDQFTNTPRNVQTAPICPPSNTILNPANYTPTPSSQRSKKPAPPALKLATKPHANGKPQARYGGMRKDKDGEWSVLLLADGKWYRCWELGLAPPAF